MNLKKIAIATAVSAALGGAGGIASAAIIGVPGEALLVPMVLSDSADLGVDEASGLDTYVALYVPTAIGEDTVISRYTTPNAAPTFTVQDIGLQTIHWKLVNEKSEYITDGTCRVSPGDLVLWTTDKDVLDIQREQQAALTEEGGESVIPNSVCGTSVKFRIGYLTFQTARGYAGRAANFAFAGAAAILDGGYFRLTESFASVPVIPMADGNDTIPPAGPRLRN